MLNLGLNLGEVTHARNKGVQGLDYWPFAGRFALNGPYVSSPEALPGASFSRTGAGTLTDGGGIVIPFPTGVRRWAVGRGELVENARTNLLPWSDTSDWSISNLTRSTDGTLAPNGAVATRLTVTASGVATNYSRSMLGTGSASGNAFSIYIKKASGAANLNSFGFRNSTTATNLILCTVNLDTGAVTYIAGSSGVTVTAGPNGWWRVTLAPTSGISAGNDLIVYAGAYGSPAAITGQSSYFAMAQLEAGSTASSHINTTGSAATRGADNPLILGLAALQAQCAGGMTLLAEIEGEPAAVAGLSFAGIASLTDGALTNRATLSRVANGALGSRVTVGGSVASPGDIAWPAGAGIKRIGLSIVPGRAIACINGALSTTSAPAGVPNFTQLGIGIGDPGSGVLGLDGVIRRIRVVPRGFSDAELQAAA